MRGIKKRSDPASRTVISRLTRRASRAAGEASDPEEVRTALFAFPFPLVPPAGIAS